MPSLSPQTLILLQRYQKWYESLEQKDEQMLHVDEVASKVAKFYEKIRGVVEWKEEHLLRKSAIERILKRRFLMEEHPESMAQSLTLELIRGGHFPNDAIPESKIKEIRHSLEKYFFLLQQAYATKKEKEVTTLYDWMLSIAACEVEDILSPRSRELALIDYMTDFIAEHLEIQGTLVDTTKEIQIFIACQQTLFRLDVPLITYHLLGRLYSSWKALSPASAELENVARNIFEIKTQIESAISHPMAPRFYSLCERLDTPFLLLGDILQHHPEDNYALLSNPPEVERAVQEKYTMRLTRLLSKLKRTALYTTLSIFITKILIALAAEIPIERWLTGHVNIAALAVSITIPPLLMGALILSIRPPSRENFQRILLEMGKIIYQEGKKPHYILRIPRPRNIVVSSFITVAYLLSFLLSFGILLKILTWFKVTIFSQIIFLIFLSLIAYAGVRLRHHSKELIVIEEKGTLIGGIFDFLSFPLIQTGRWLSSKLIRYNLILILLNALVEMPLQMFIEFLEHWRAFVKEKKEEIH